MYMENTMDKKIYIFKESTNFRFEHYFGRRCVIGFFRDPETNLLRATIDFIDYQNKWIRTSILALPPRDVGSEHIIRTINSVYTFVDTGEIFKETI